MVEILWEHVGYLHFILFHLAQLFQIIQLLKSLFVFSRAEVAIAFPLESCKSVLERHSYVSCINVVELFVP